MATFRERKNPLYLILLLIGLAAVTIRLLMDSRFGTSGLLYIAVPYSIATALYLFTILARAKASSANT